MMEEPIVAGSTTLLHPKEQAIQIRSAAQRKKQVNKKKELRTCNIKSEMVVKLKPLTKLRL